MSQLHHKKGIDFGAYAKGYSFFALMLCLFMMGTSFTSIDYNHQSANATIAPHAAQGYFVQEEIPGSFKMPQANLGKEDFNLQKDRNQILMEKSDFEKSSYEDVGIQIPRTETNVTIKSTSKKINFNSNKIQFSDSDTPENFDIILN